MHTLRLISTTVLIALCNTSALAQTTWTGATSTDWGTASNWSAGVPTSSIDAVIAPAGQNPNTSGATAECRDLTVQSGATLDIAVGFPVTVHRNCNSSGTINGGLIQCVTTANNTLAGGPYPDVDISGRMAVNATVNGTFRHLPGANVLTLFTSTFNGPVTFDGLRVAGGVGTVTFNDDVAFATSGTTTAPAPTIIFNGTNWTSGATFAMTTGAVTFGRSGAQNLDQAGSSWFRLTIGASSITTLTGNLLTGSTLEVNGQLQAASTTSIQNTAGGIDVSSGGLINAPLALLDIDGQVNMAGTLTIGGAGGTPPHTFSDGFNLSGTLNAPADVRFLFDGTANDTIAGGPYPDVDISGRMALNATFNGTFRHLAGANALSVTNNVFNGTATFSGLRVSGGIGSLTFNDDVTFETSGVTSGPSPTIVFNGTTWTSNANFAATTGHVRFNRAGSQTITQTGSSWSRLTIETGSVTTINGNILTRSTLTVNGELQATGATSIQVTAGGIEIPVSGLLNAPSSILDINGQVNLDGTLTIGGFGGVPPHTFSNGFNLTGTLNNASGARFLFDGTANNTIAGGPYPDVDVSGRMALNGTFAGVFRHLAGADTLTVATCVFEGPATFSGFRVNGGVGSLTFVKEVTFETSGVTSSPSPTIFFNGPTWTSNANFLPTSSVVVFGGTGQQTVNATTFTVPTLTIGTASSVTLIVANLTVQSSLTVNGAMNTPSSSLQVNQNLTVSGTGQLTVNPGTHTIAGNYSNSGTTTGPGTLTLTGSGKTWSGPGRHGNVEVASAGTIAVTSPVVAGNVTLTTGTLEVTSTHTLSASGDVTLTAGTLQGPTTAGFDIEGTMTITSALAGTTLPEIFVAGDYTAGPSFAPPSGTIWLDGSSTTQLRATAPGGAVQFFNLMMDNGERAVGNPINIQGTGPGATIGVCSAATFNIGSQPISVTQCMNFVVEGGMTVDPGGSVALDGDSTFTVKPVGTLRMLGSPEGGEAVFEGFGGVGGYCSLIQGTIEASYFEFRGMGPEGIQIEAAAKITALDNGRFAEGSAQPGAVLLDIERSTPITLHDIDFDNSGATATFNVRSGSTLPNTITFANYSGGFGGPAFEDDPNGVIEWTSAGRTELASFTATGGVGRVDLTFTTTQEIDAQSFQFMRATDPLGPFVSIGSAITPTGSPTTGASYALTDTAVVFPTTYYYRVEETRTNARMRVLGTANARPLPATGQLGPSYFVGQGGFASIATALSTAPPGATVMVSAGTYPAFTVTQPVRILARGAVTIDTSSAPVEVRDIAFDPANPDVVLSGLTLGSPTSPNGLQVTNVDDIVVLDSLSITVMSGVDSLIIDDCPQVAVQSCTLAGGTGGRVRNASVAFMSGGATPELHVETNSSVTHAGLTPGTTNVDGSSTVNPLTGTAPRVDFPHDWVSGSTTPIQVTSDPGDAWALILSFGKSWAPAPLPGYDMVMLQNPLLLITLSAGVVPGGGTSTLDFPVPDLGSGSWGVSLPVQLLKVDLGPGGRFGNVRDPLILP